MMHQETTGIHAFKEVVTNQKRIDELPEGSHQSFFWSITDRS